MSAIFSSWRFQSIVHILYESLNLQRRGITGRSVGDVIADIIAYSIIVQVDKGLNPDGQRLPKLSRSWLVWKMLHGKNPALLHEDDLMMDFRQVRGMVVISKDKMSMFYGITPAEIDKAFWTQEGAVGGGVYRVVGQGSITGWHRPPREFFGINRDGWNKVDEYCDKEIDAVIMGLNAKRLP